MTSYNSKIINHNTELQYSKLKESVFNEPQQNWTSLRRSLDSMALFTQLNSSLNESIVILEKFSSYLENAEDMLELAKSVVEMFNQLESLIMSTIWTLLDFFISQIEQLLNDIKSTGFYALQYITPYLMSENKSYDYQQSLYYGAWYDLNIDKEERLNNLTGILDSLSVYKAVSYYDFIADITEAFYNKNDTPQGDIFKNPFTKAALDPTTTIFRPGIPKFGDNCKVAGGALIFAVPDIKKAIQNVINLMVLFKSLFQNIPDNKDIDSIRNVLNSAFDFQEFKNAWEEFNKTPLKQQVTTRPDPSFVGLNAYQLAPELFDLLDRFVKLAKGFIGADPLKDSGMSAAILRKIEQFQEYIQAIQNVIKHVESIIQIIEVFLSFTDMFWIWIETEHGISGFLEQLRNATGIFDPKVMRDELIAVGIPEEYVDEFIGMRSGEIETAIKQNIEQLDVDINATQQDYNLINNELNKNNEIYVVILNTIIKQVTNYANALLSSTYCELNDLIYSKQKEYDDAYKLITTQFNMFITNNAKHLLSTYIAAKENLLKTIDESLEQYDSNGNLLNKDILTWRAEINSVLLPKKQDIESMLQIYTAFPEGLEDKINELTLEKNSIIEQIEYLENEINAIKIDVANKVNAINSKIDFVYLQNNFLETRFALNDYNFDYQSHINAIHSYIDLLNNNLNTLTTDLNNLNNYYTAENNALTQNIDNIQNTNLILETQKNSKEIELNWANEKVIYYTQYPPANSSQQEEYNYALNIVNTYPAEINNLVNAITENKHNIDLLKQQLASLIEATTENKAILTKNIENKFEEKIICQVYIEYATYKIAMFKNRYEKNAEIAHINQSIDKLCEQIKEEQLTYDDLFKNNVYFSIVDTDLKRYGFSFNERELTAQKATIIGSYSTKEAKEAILKNITAAPKALEAYYKDEHNKTVIKQAKSAEQLINLKKKRDAFNKIISSNDKILKLKTIDTLYDIWNPNTKMYYGGVLFCFGYPDFNDYEVLNWNTDMQEIYKMQVDYAKNQFFESESTANSQEFFNKSVAGFERIKKILKKIKLG